MISGERRMAEVKQAASGSIERIEFITIGCGQLVFWITFKAF